MSEFNSLSLFSGIGGIDLAFNWAGGNILAFCEIDPFCQKVLHKHWPDVPIFGDIRKLTREVIMSALRNPKYDEAVILYQMGMSVRDIAEYFGVTHQTMWLALKRRITLRPRERKGEENVFYRGGIARDKRAAKITDNAIRYGYIINPHICEECGCTDSYHKNGASDIQAHHDDYNHPLKVRWLCQKCHFEWHKTHKAKEVVADEGAFNESTVDVIYGGFPC